MRAAPLLAALVLAATADARAQQVTCAGAPGLVTGMPIDDVFGAYTYFGATAFDGQPGVEFASGTGHHDAVGLEFTAALSTRNLLVGMSVRAPVLRAGLGEDWTGGVPPTFAFILAPRFGVATVAAGTRNFGAWLGVDAEWLIVGQILVALRSGLYVPFDPATALVRPVPMVTLAAGFGPGGAYGWLR